MNMQNTVFPKIAHVAPSVTDAKCEAKIPDLTTADFHLVAQPVYSINQMGMAERVDERRGLPTKIFVEKETNKVVHLATPEYRVIENWEAHEIIKDALIGMFPSKYLQNVRLTEFVENGFAYSEMNYQLGDLKFKVSAPNGWETELSPNIMVKNATQHSLITVVGAHCSETENKISFGNRAANSQRHVDNFGAKPIVDHLRQTLTKFPDAVKATQGLVNEAINIDQAKNALSMYSSMTDTVMNEILQHYAANVSQEIGKNKFGLMMSVADFANNATLFPVKNSAKADNVAETLATRKKWLAGLVSSPFFYGKGGFYA